MDNLLTFVNEELGYIRGITIEDQPWFVGKDIASALGYTNTRKAILDHVPDHHKRDGVTIRDSIGREQQPILIDESGLYRLIFSSKLESAERFTDWVTSEVLPSIRRNSFYGEFPLDYRLKSAEIISKTPIKRMKYVTKVLGITVGNADVPCSDTDETVQAKAIKDFVSTVKFFLDSLVEPIPEFTPTKFVFDNYVKWCGSNNAKPISRVEFSRKLTKLLNRPIINKKVNGEKARVLV